MEIFPEKRYNIFPMSAVFRVWPVLARVLWIAAAIALAAPVALAEEGDSRPVSAGEFNREVGRMDKKLDNLSEEVKELTRNMAELSKNVAVLTEQMAALAKAVDKQGGGNWRRAGRAERALSDDSWRDYCALPLGCWGLSAFC